MLNSSPIFNSRASGALYPAFDTESGWSHQEWVRRCLSLLPVGADKESFPVLKWTYGDYPDGGVGKANSLTRRIECAEIDFLVL